MLFRYVERDLLTNTTSFHVHEDYGIIEIPTPKNQGTSIESARDEVWSITQDDPLSSTGKATFKVALQRHDEHNNLIHTTTVSDSEIRCTKDEWIWKAKLTAYQDKTLIFEKDFSKNIPRDFM